MSERLPFLPAFMKTPKYRGIIPPMVTPLRGPDTLDVAGLELLVEHILAGGVQGLFLLGTTGEGPSINYGLRRELIERTCRLVDGRAHVLVGITDTVFQESLNVARWSADAGADALVVAPPYYLPAGQPELQEYIGRLVPGLPLPLLLYNMPSLTKVHFGLETLRRALDDPRIMGLKDSSGDMGYFHRVTGLLRQRPDWSLMIGPEELLPDAVFAGGNGGVCGGANLFPRLYVDLFNAAQAGDVARTRERHQLVMRVGELYRIGSHSSAVIKGIKCALALNGICKDFMSEPFQRFCEPERERVRHILDELNPLLKSL